jgi:hypothetical protein
MSEETTTEELYPVDTLLANAQQIFGQPSYVVVGAVDAAGLDGQLVTKTTLAKAIAGFLAQKDPRHVEG